jgi:hypothetical protein
MTPAFALLLVLGAEPDQQLAARPTRGQELVYRGRFREETRGSTTDQRAYDLEARTCVLEAGGGVAEVALLTILRAAGSAPDASGSARLELATVDSRGRLALQPEGRSPRLALDGPPSLEPAGFVELPAGSATVWDASDGARPPREWRVVGEDFRRGVRCLRLVGEQESADWRRPTGDGAAWRRTDTVWLAANAGIVLRLERTIERRGDGAAAAGYLSRTEYALAEDSTLPDRLAGERQHEIREAAELRRRLGVLLPHGGHVAPLAQFTALIERIDHHCATQPATPYRSAVMALRRRAETGARGEVPPPADAPEPPTPAVAVGRAAPDFVTTDLVTGSSIRLARWRGQPVVLLFVRPDNPAAAPTLEKAMDLSERYAGRIHVAVLVVADEDRPRPAWAAFRVPLFAGKDVAGLYVANGPSRVVVVDADGVVRHFGECGPGVIDAVQRLVSGQ